MPRFTDIQTLLDGVVLADTQAGVLISEAMDVSMRPDVAFQFTCADHTSGNGVFVVQVSIDGTNFVDYNRLTDNVTNTNGQNDTRVGSVTLNSNTSKVYFRPNGDWFRYVRIKITITTDGTYSATVGSCD